MVPVTRVGPKRRWVYIAPHVPDEPCCGRSQARDCCNVLREVIDDRVRQSGTCCRQGSRIVGGRWSADLWLLLEVTVDGDLECALRALPGGKLDVGGSEQIAGLDQRVEVDALKDACGDIAPPDRRARGGVGSADGNDVIKPPVAQERRIERADEVGRADEQSPVALPESGDDLQELVGDALQR